MGISKLEYKEKLKYHKKLITFYRELFSALSTPSQDKEHKIETLLNNLFAYYMYLCTFIFEYKEMTSIILKEMEKIDIEKDFTGFPEADKLFTLLTEKLPKKLADSILNANSILEKDTVLQFTIRQKDKEAFYEAWREGKVSPRFCAYCYHFLLFFGISDLKEEIETKGSLTLDTIKPWAYELDCADSFSLVEQMEHVDSKEEYNELLKKYEVLVPNLYEFAVNNYASSKDQFSEDEQQILYYLLTDGLDDDSVASFFAKSEESQFHLPDDYFTNDVYHKAALRTEYVDALRSDVINQGPEAFVKFINRLAEKGFIEDNINVKYNTAYHLSGRKFPLTLSVMDKVDVIGGDEKDFFFMCRHLYEQRNNITDAFCGQFTHKGKTFKRGERPNNINTAKEMPKVFDGIYKLKGKGETH